MNEVGTAILAISLVLTAVFVPTAFIPGISGQFYKQFAVTIAASTIISAINSLSLSPALAAALLKPHDAHASGNRLVRGGRWFAGRFNAGFDRRAAPMPAACEPLPNAKSSCSRSMPAFVGSTVYMANAVPRGFIPQLDQGYAIVVIQLPDGSSLSRTDAVVQKASKIMLDTPGIVDAVAFAGFSGATFTNASNQAAIFARFAPFEERLRHGQSGTALIGQLVARLDDRAGLHHRHTAAAGSRHRQCRRLQDRAAGAGRRLDAARSRGGPRDDGEGPTTPQLTGVFTTFSASSPQIYLEIDRTKARMLDVPIANIFEALQVNLGTSYVNDFNAFGRVYQVRAQADQKFRLERQDVLRLKVEIGDRRAGAAGRDPRRLRPRPRSALQHVHRRAGAGERRARLFFGHCPRCHGDACPRGVAAGHELRMDGACLPGAPDRQSRHLHLRAFGLVRLPGARRAI